VRWPPRAISDANVRARVADTWCLGIVILFPSGCSRARVRSGSAPAI
jgi:hypothetical protein